MTATGKATRYSRSFGLPWVGEVPQEASHVGISAPAPLRLDRDPVETVAGTFLAQRGGSTASVCQVDWRVEGQTADPVLPSHFQGDVLPEGQIFFAAGVVEVPVSFLVSPGADPARESYGRVLLENPVNCEIAAGRGELPLSITAEAVVPGDAIVSLDVPFSVIDPEAEGPVTPLGYALGPDYTVNWTLHEPVPASSSLTQEAAGVVLQANANANAWLFAKLAPPANWILTCDYTWLDGSAGTAGGILTRFAYVRGIGTGGIEADPNLWSAADAGAMNDADMDAKCTGVRANLNTKYSTAAPSNEARMLIYDPTVPGTQEIEADGGNDFTFPNSTRYRLQVERAGSRMIFSKSAPGTASETVSFTAPEIGAIGTAWIAFAAVNGRRCRISDLTLVENDEPVLSDDYTYEWDLASYRTLPDSTGADLWPSTWALDGTVYTVFGDGPAASGSVSIGLARFTGTTQAGLAIDYLVGGVSPSVRPQFAPVAGFPTTPEGGLHAKCSSLIALGGSLYLWLVRGGTDEVGWTDTRLARIDLGNIAAGPTLSSWAIGSGQPWAVINPAFLQCGRNFSTAWDGYIYAFPQHHAPVENEPGDSPSHNPGRFYLIRCLRTANPQTQASWQWWTGGTDAAPTWGTYANRQARITMSGQIDWRPSAFYIQPPVNRCVFRIGRTLGIEGGVPATWPSGLTPPYPSLSATNIIKPPAGEVRVHYEPTAPGPGYTYDCRDTLFKSHENNIYPCSINFRDETSVAGLRTLGEQPLDIVWRISKRDYDGDGLRMQGAGDVHVDGAHIENVEDGYSPRGLTGGGDMSWEVINSYMYYIRDDAFENDNLNPGLIRGCLIDGTKHFLSQRPGADSNVTNPSMVTRIEDTLVHLLQMPYDTDASGDPAAGGSLVDGKGNGQLFKWGGTRSGSVACLRCIFLVDWLSINGANSMDFPPGTYEGCTLIYNGPGAYPGALPASGVTETDSMTTWTNARTAWLTSHGYNDTGENFGGGSMSRFATFIAERPWHAWTMIADQQYTATGLDPDLAQVSALPHTVAIDGEGVATWLDTTWGGGNTDACIVAPSTLTPRDSGGEPGDPDDEGVPPPPPTFGGTQRWVSPSGTGNGLSSGSPSNMNAAVAAASSNDVINILPGTYPSFEYEGSKSLHFRGTVPVLSSIDTSKRTTGTKDTISGLVVRDRRTTGVAIFGAPTVPEYRHSFKLTGTSASRMLVENLYFMVGVDENRGPERHLETANTGTMYIRNCIVGSCRGFSVLCSNHPRIVITQCEIFNDLEGGPRPPPQQDENYENLTDYGIIIYGNRNDECYIYQNLIWGHFNQAIAIKHDLDEGYIVGNLFFSGDGGAEGWVTPFMWGQSADKTNTPEDPNNTDYTCGYGLVAHNTFQGSETNPQVCNVRRVVMRDNNLLNVNHLIRVWLNGGGVPLTVRGPIHTEEVWFYNNYVHETSGRILLEGRGVIGDTFYMGTQTGPGRNNITIVREPPDDTIDNPQTLAPPTVVNITNPVTP